jgi:streptogramin lyase
MRKVCLYGIGLLLMAVACPAQVTFTDYSIPTAGSGANFITTGPDGNLWFTEYFGNTIGRITPAGVVTEFPIPTPGVLPPGIAVGPDGNLWFTIKLGAQLARSICARSRRTRVNAKTADG